MASTVMRIWIRHDSLRPASWVSLCLAVCAPMAPLSKSGLPLFGWGILTAAVAIGIGEVPAPIPLWSFQVRARRWVFGGVGRSVSAVTHGVYWHIVRLIWPTAGLVTGVALMAILWPIHLAEQLPWLIGEGSVVIVLTAGTLVTFLISDLLIADAYSGTLVTGWSAITIVGWIFSVLPPGLGWMTPFVLFAGWICVGFVLLLLAAGVFSGGSTESFGSILLRNDSVAGVPKDDVFSSIGFLGILPVRSQWRRSVRMIVIAILLVAMVWWLLLTTSATPRYELLASIVFGAIAIPAASLLDGYKVVSDWEYLVPHRRQTLWSEILTTPNRISQAGIVLISYGAIILWPPLVVSLAAVGSSGSGNGLQAVSFLAVIAVTTLMACLLSQRARARTETVFALSLTVWVMGVWAMVLVCQSLS